MKLLVEQDTFFKLSTADSLSLPTDEKVLITKGRSFEVHSHQAASNNHVKAALLNASLGTQNRNTWYIYREHVSFEGNIANNQPNDFRVATQTTPEGNILLPNGKKVAFNTPILSGGHFSWGEVMQWDMKRIPPNRIVLEQILRAATAMEEVRSYFNDASISVNSWYRPPAVNRAVGGASQSRHLVGDALDFNVKGIPPHTVRYRMESWWASRGGLASADTFTHLDLRGYRARWEY